MDADYQGSDPRMACAMASRCGWDEDQIADVLKSERLGHDEPGMRDVYGHVSWAMGEELKAALQAR